MQLLIENTLMADTQVIDLANRSYHIGRATECDIVLPSPFVSRDHALIEYSKPAFTIQPMGMNGTFVNDIELKKMERVLISAGDKIRIGEYVLSVSARWDWTVSEESKLDLRKKFVELESKVHDLLLMRLDLRKGDPVSTRQNEQRKWSEEHLRTVHKHLTGILNEQDLGITPEIERYIVKGTLKTELMDGITFQGSRQHNEFKVPGETQSVSYESEIELIKLSLADQLQVDNDPRHLRENVSRLDKGFEDAINRCWLEMSAGLRRYILKRRIRNDVHDMIVGLGPLQDLLNYPNISEIMVVSRDQIYIEKNGVIEESGRAFVSDDVGLSIIERIVAPLGRRIDKSQPLVDARLPDGSRVNAIIPPLALKGPCITIRKFSRTPFTVDDLIDKGTLNRKTANFLKACVLGKKNIIISGGTGSGKTTLLNVLSSFISPNERIVTIEDSAELQLVQRHVVQLETKLANIEGTGAFSIRDLVKNALRMRPDRIVVGECRGGEALDMLQAMNTGHSGSMTTGHANSPDDVLLRLETMVLMAVQMPILAIRSQIASALDLIVQQARIGGKRRVTHISEVVTLDEREHQVILEDIFVYRRSPGGDEEGELVYTGYIPTFLGDLLNKDILKLDDIF